MNVTDHQLSAWLSGCLNADEAAQIAAAVEADPALAKRAERLRHLDELVRTVVPLDAVIPDALIARLGLAAAPATADRAATAPVIDLAGERARRAEQAAALPTEPQRSFHGWRIAAQVALIVGIGMAALQFMPRGAEKTPEGAYRVLSDDSMPQPDADALVMFAPGTTPQAARAIVLAAGGTVVGEPTAAGAIRIKTGANREDMLARLRARADVIMAEPVDPATSGAGQP